MSYYKKPKFKIGDKVQLKTIDEILERFQPSASQIEDIQAQQGKIFKITGLPDENNESIIWRAAVYLDKNIFPVQPGTDRGVGNVIHHEALVLCKSCQLELNKELFEI